MRLKVIFLVLFLLFITNQSLAKERQGIVTFNIILNTEKASEKARLWLPYPLSDEFQSIENVKVNGNHSYSAIYREPESEVVYLYAEWDRNSKEKSLIMSFYARAEERIENNLRDKNLPVPVEIEKYLEADKWAPTDGIVKEIADKITNGKTGILEKSRAVYDWVVENTYRDPNIKGCGLGIVEQTLAERGGKCADISSVYVALARAAGVPARDVFGLRLGKEPEQDISSGFNCWAEFYLPGTGWVQVNPADVRKIMLKKKLSINQAKSYREYYFGAVDEYRIVLERGARGIVFNPKQDAEPLNYFMYPYAEIDGEPLDYFDPKNFGYSIQFKEI
jgi:transglutaminase-like putative cysteine protease